MQSSMILAIRAKGSATSPVFQGSQALPCTMRNPGDPKLRVYYLASINSYLARAWYKIQYPSATSGISNKDQHQLHRCGGPTCIGEISGLVSRIKNKVYRGSSRANSKDQFFKMRFRRKLVMLNWVTGRADHGIKASSIINDTVKP